MTRVVLALGSNLGDRQAALSGALSLLAESGVDVVAVSAAYETDPVGGPQQPDYLNAVVVAETAMTPDDLLRETQAVEAALGRVRAERWGPRTVDIDIIVYADLVTHDPRLTLPHPRAHERAFVLVPWLDVEPDAVLPGHGRVTALLADLDADGVRRRDDLALRLPA